MAQLCKHNLNFFFCLNLFSVQQYQLFILERTSLSNFKMLGNILLNCCSRKEKGGGGERINQPGFKASILTQSSSKSNFIFPLKTLAVAFQKESMGDLEDCRLCNLHYCYQKYTDTSEVLKQNKTPPYTSVFLSPPPARNMHRSFSIM